MHITALTNVSVLADAFVKQNQTGNQLNNVCQIFYSFTTDFLPEHLYHVNSFLVRWQARCGRCCNEIVGTSPHTYGHTRGADVHPQSTQEVARSKSML